MHNNNNEINMNEKPIGHFKYKNPTIELSKTFKN